MEKIGWTDRVRNEEALRRVKEETNILHIIKRREANCILRRNCLLKDVIEGNVEGRIGVTERRGRRRKKILDSPKEVRDEALDHTVWKTRFGRDHGPVVGQTTDDECVVLCILNVLVLIL
jgi:hypothetical protein